MRITCNRIGGFNIHGIPLSHGENEVDDQKWAEAVARCPPKWIAALTSGDKPELVIHDATPVAPVDAAEKRAGVVWSAEEQEKIDAINACCDLRQVERMAENELRLPILDAIDKRLNVLEALVERAG